MATGMNGSSYHTLQSNLSRGIEELTQLKINAWNAKNNFVSIWHCFPDDVVIQTQA